MVGSVLKLVVFSVALEEGEVGGGDVVEPVVQLGLGFLRVSPKTRL